MTADNPFPLGQPGFVSHPIDRAAHLRTNAEKLFALEGDRKARAYVMHRDSILMTQGADGPRLARQWVESGGPPVAPPSRRGFGSRMIERGLASELHGTVVLEFAPEGVRCTINAPLPSA